MLIESTNCNNTPRGFGHTFLHGCTCMTDGSQMHRKPELRTTFSFDEPWIGWMVVEI